MKDIYDLVKTEKTAYETTGVPIAGSWDWSMFNHCNYSLLMKNSQFPTTQTKMGDRPLRNIIRPILNVAYRSEGFDVKDIELYVNDKDSFHLSFLARKFHTNWALENQIDTFIDDVVETYVDYGGVIVKNVNDKKPEVVPFQQIAFVDQTDILSGTIAIKHQYSIDQLKDTVEEQGWYKDEVNMAILSAENYKDNSQANNSQAKTPSKYIEVFEVHGTFPETWLTRDDDEDYNAELDANKYSKQIHIITYLKDSKDNRQGICLFKGVEKKPIFKVLVRDKIFGRALGFGGVEELFEPQLWTNFNLIHMTNMLKEASKVIHITDDEGFTTRNNTKNLQGGEFLTLDPGKTATQLNTQPVNYTLFDRAFQEWEQHARTMGAASDPQLGLNPVSGTPLGTTQIVTAQGLGIHDYRRGKIASFIEEIYRDWVLDYLVADMNKGLEWVDDLSIDEMEDLADKVMTNEFNRYVKEKILSGQLVTEEELTPLREQFKKDFKKSSKKFLKIVKGEFAKIPMKVKINVAGKQKDLSRMADKLSNLFRAVFANPQGFMETMKIPGVRGAFNEMLEYSGMKQVDFSNMPQQIPQSVPQEMPSPIQPSQLTQQ